MIILSAFDWISNIAAYGPLTVAGLALSGILIIRITPRLEDRRYRKTRKKRDHAIAEIIDWARDISDSRAASEMEMMSEPEDDVTKWDYDAKESARYISILQSAMMRNRTIGGLVQDPQLSGLKDKVDRIARLSDQISESARSLSLKIESSLQTEKDSGSDPAILKEHPFSDTRYAATNKTINTDIEDPTQTNIETISHDMHELDKQKRDLERRCTDLMNAAYTLKTQAIKDTRR